MVDNEIGGYMALEHLYSLGHRQIAFIRGPKTLSDSAPRWKGVRNFAQKHGLVIDPRLVMDLPESRDPRSSVEAGFSFTEELLRSKRPFTGLVAFDDMSAFGAVRALSKAGLRVPDHCSVVGFDDVAASSFYTPALTTVRQPMEAMGSAAATIVLEGISAVQEKRESSVSHRKMGPELVVRESTKGV